MSQIKNTESFRNAFRKALRSRSLTLADLQRAASEKNIMIPAKETMYRWMNGKTSRIYESSLAAVAQALGISLLDFLDELSPIEYVTRADYADKARPSTDGFEESIPGNRSEKFAEPGRHSEHTAVYPDQANRLLTLKRIVYGLIFMITVLLLSVALKRYVFYPHIYKLSRSANEHIVYFLNEASEPIDFIDLETETVTPMLIGKGRHQLVVVGIKSDDNPTVPAGSVIAYNNYKDSLWTFDTFDLQTATFLKCKGLSPHASHRKCSGYFVVDGLYTGTFFGEDKIYLVVLASDPDYGASRISILEPFTGNEVYTFWSGGSINGEDSGNSAIQLYDLNEDGIMEIYVPGWHNDLLREINSRLGYAINSELWTATWKLEPMKNGRFCSLLMDVNEPCPVNPSSWYVFTHRLNDVPSVEFNKHPLTGEPIVKIGDSVAGLYYDVTYKGEILDCFEGRWQVHHGKKKSPPIILLKTFIRGMKAELRCNERKDFDLTMSYLYNDDQIRRAKMLLSLFD